jgi:hypothetical protein
MAEKNFTGAGWVSLATAAKTLVATVPVPLGVSKLIEIGDMLGGLGVTTLFSYDHILQIECDDQTEGWAGTQQFACPGPTVLGTDVAPIMPATIHDCNIMVKPNAHLLCYIISHNSPTIKPDALVFGKFI